MKNKLEIRFKELTEILLSEINNEGFWEGKLSSSALGVAVSVAALHFYAPLKNQYEIQKGLEWLRNNINSDGSYGDTPESPGNISTSLLVYAALNLYSIEDKSIKETQKKIANYLLDNSINVNSNQVTKAILTHYKKDYTFSVPILTMSALCGVLGKDGFKEIPQLPFELALFPKKLYKILNLNVVSYAIPALIAVGILTFKNKKQNKISQIIRKKSIYKALAILEKTTPQSGGFLEAIPLTAFVALSLINSGHYNSSVVEKGIDFLKKTQRSDGSWPIDINLSTWVTTLSIKSLRSKSKSILSIAKQKKLTEHLLSTQNKTIHPFNGTQPGGWGWTNYSGSVPDCDDTPGTILALLTLKNHQEIQKEIFDAVNWLLLLQNSDGGFPTFSKGWGKLPFDQSCSDLTGHCFLALATVSEVYKKEISPLFQKKIDSSIEKSLLYLENHQQENGSWLPLWFGNQFTSNHTNPVYGTARVISYLNDTLRFFTPGSKILLKISQLIEGGKNYLVEAQNKDGSWGGDKSVPGSIEETALAVSALTSTEYNSNCKGGLNWLDSYFKQNGLKPAPIGLYFASLWYDEKLYPLTFYLDAISRSLKY